MRYRILDTPTGPFALRETAAAQSGSQLETSWLRDSDDPFIVGGERSDSLRPDVVDALERYFAGDDVDFGFVATPDGPTFFRRCWDACRCISRGRTSTYGDLARATGSGPGAARAAGQAMRRNRLPIIIPCHRVVGRNDLGGFSGTRRPGDQPLRVKEWLLGMELGMEQRLTAVDNDHLWPAPADERPAAGNRRRSGWTALQKGTAP